MKVKTSTCLFTNRGNCLGVYWFYFHFIEYWIAAILNSDLRRFLYSWYYLYKSRNSLLFEKMANLHTVLMLYFSYSIGNWSKKFLFFPYYKTFIRINGEWLPTTNADTVYLLHLQCKMQYFLTFCILQLKRLCSGRISTNGRKVTRQLGK